jgi:hypothetical protein
MAAPENSIFSQGLSRNTQGLDETGENEDEQGCSTVEWLTNADELQTLTKERDDFVRNSKPTQGRTMLE